MRVSNVCDMCKWRVWMQFCCWEDTSLCFGRLYFCSWFWNLVLIKVGQISFNCLQTKSTQCRPICTSLSQVLSNVYMLEANSRTSLHGFARYVVRAANEILCWSCDLQSKFRHEPNIKNHVIYPTLKQKLFSTAPKTPFWVSPTLQLLVLHINT